MARTPQPEGCSWRDLLLRSLTNWGLVFGGVMAVMVAYTYAFKRPLAWSSEFIAMYLGYGGLIVARLLPTRAYRVRAVSVCGSIFVAAVSGIVFVGLNAGPALCLTTSVLAAGLFLGRSGAGVWITISALAVFVWGRPVAPADYSALLSAVSFVCMTGVLSLVVLFVVRHLERSLAVTAKALADLRAEQALREATQADLSSAQSALYQSQKLDAVGRLAGGVAHEFNNTLQVVIGWAELLQTTTDRETVKEGLAQIRGAAEQSSSLTRQLLAFSRPEMRSPSPIPLSTALPLFVGSYRQLLPDDVSLELDVRAGLIVRMDEAQLNQVLLNLVLNARDAMPRGGSIRLAARLCPPAELRTGPSVVDEPRVELVVSDTGVGMDRDTQARMFEPFFTTKGKRGSGLGLAAVYGVVQQAEGAIHVDSAPDRGTTFTIYLPAAEAGTARSASAANPRAKLSGEGCRLLLAEDDPGVRRSLEHALVAAGYDVVTVGDVQSGREVVAAQGEQIDVLVTDGIMPGGHTRQLIDDYLVARPDGRVILCSGYVDGELAARGLESPALEFLPKPFAPITLVEKLSRK